MIVPSGILDKVEPPSVEPPSSGGEGATGAASGTTGDTALRHLRVASAGFVGPLSKVRNASILPVSRARAEKSGNR